MTDYGPFEFYEDGKDGLKVCQSVRCRTLAMMKSSRHWKLMYEYYTCDLCGWELKEADEAYQKPPRS